MNRRTLKLGWVVALVPALALLATASWRLTGRGLPSEWRDVRRLPQIRPDYTGTVIPPNIAPLNFRVEEPGVEFRVRIHGATGGDFIISSRNPDIVIPAGPWRALLNTNRGGAIKLDVFVKGADSRWSHFDTVENAVAAESIDSHLVYRLLGPVCNLYHDLGIYQRNLENYDQSPVLENDRIGHGCINCHSFPNNRPDLFSFHVRPGPDRDKSAAGMILVRDGHAVRLETKSAAAPGLPGYLSWHPTGSSVAFSMAKPGQVFRAAGDEIRDVFDFRSDIAVMNVGTCSASTSPGVADSEWLETFPSWSADGRTLYFCRAKQPWKAGEPVDPEDLKAIKFDLMRVGYNPERNEWGQPETVLSAAETGKSLVEPRASPDGRYLLFCMTDYGSFPIHQAGCDLCLMDLQSGAYRRLDCNSDRTDSWHCWSSNSRWIVFSSKRDNGLLARPYFSYVDAEGHDHKPFVLPQKNPAFYLTWLKTYNVPELITGAVTVPQEELARVIRKRVGS